MGGRRIKQGHNIIVIRGSLKGMILTVMQVLETNEYICHGGGHKVTLKRRNIKRHYPHRDKLMAVMLKVDREMYMENIKLRMERIKVARKAMIAKFGNDTN